MINRAILVGRVTKDVEVQKTQSGISVCSFVLACDKRNKNDGADFIACQAWRQGADFLGKYAKKGMVVGVDGRINTRNYENRDGQKVYVTEVIAENVRIFGGVKTKENEISYSDEYFTEETYDSGSEIDPDSLPF